MALILVSSILLSLFAAPTLAQEAIPDYVKDYAPIVYLDKNELYLPSDIKSHIDNTYPTLNYSRIDSIVPFDLSNLDQLNAVGECTAEEFGSCPVYLTSLSNISDTPKPEWTFGVLPEEDSGETKGATSSTVIIHDHGDGLVDAFYFYFYSFNEGNEFMGDHWGNHVGDWEHNMIRFQDGKPQAIWYAQHNSGQAFTYEAVSKEGKRPVVYSSLGGHASYAVPGIQFRLGGAINDSTSRGPMWDPTLNAYYYTYKPFPPSSSSPNAISVNGTFTAMSPDAVISWLYFLGRWGDKTYPLEDARQRTLSIGYKYRLESGPTGPLDKQLSRDDICPGAPGQGRCVTLTELPKLSGSESPVTVTRSTSITGTSAGDQGATPTNATGSSESGLSSETGTGTAAGAAATQTGGGAAHCGKSKRWQALGGIALALWAQRI